jgi:tRNA(Ile)-lysidine synthase
VAEVDRLVTDWHGQGPLDLPGQVSAARRCGRLRFSNGNPTSSGPT